jgi:hypothetical protein
MGAAAIAGGQRISATSVSSEVSKLETYYQANKAKIQLQFPLAQAPQQVLGWMLRFRVRDELAVRNHLSVSTGDSQRALHTIETQSGRTGPAFAQLAVANGLPRDMLLALGRFQAIQNALLARLDGGRLPTSTAAQQALNSALNQRQCRAAKSLDIRVNPQFGRMDYATLTVIPATTPLSAPAVPAPSPSAKPALTPPC